METVKPFPVETLRCQDSQGALPSIPTTSCSRFPPDGVTIFRLVRLPRDRQDRIIDEQAPDTADDEPAPRPTYLDGTSVSDNPAEIQALAAYCQATRNKPDSVIALRNWAKRTSWTADKAA